MNDHYEAAIKHGCFGVHMGQSDLKECLKKGGIEALLKADVALGISTHGFAELSVALGLRPSYVSFGPVFGTKSKSDVGFEDQGVAGVRLWRSLIGPKVR